VSQARSAIQTVARSAPDVAALVLAVSTLAYITVILPCGGRTTRPTTRSNLASRTSSAGWTDTRVTRDTIHAGGTAGARITRTFVHINAAIRASEARCTFASEPIITVHAFATIQAWHWLTIVHIALAVRPFESLATDASVFAQGLLVHADGDAI